MEPSHINTSIQAKSRPTRSLDQYVDGILKGDRIILSEAITLVESTQPSKRKLGIDILVKINTLVFLSLRIGVTGTPGVGKSTFIESFGRQWLSKGHKVAVLAIDPSSTMTMGSILGDKNRMESLSNDPDAFIRPTPSSTMLGGIAAHTQETISLCEAAGYDRVIIETVGIGQSEIDVDNIVDINILLLQPGSGDDMQGIKRGILEKVDIIVVHKADGLQRDLAMQTQRHYQQTMAMFQHPCPNWRCPVILCSSTENIGHEDIIGAIEQFSQMAKTDYFLQKRRKQESHYIEKFALDTMVQYLRNSQIIDGTISAGISQDAPLYQRVSKLQKAITDHLQKLVP